ncbi:MAG TPA: cellulase family glycosylhydrolase [bacterium]|nr:cellulase family glycosylhydrolase [bacterium]
MKNILPMRPGIAALDLRRCCLRFNLQLMPCEKITQKPARPPANHRRGIPVFLLIFISLAAVGARAQAPAPWPLPPHLQVRGGAIVDDNGSKVILRGVAVNQLGDYFQANPDAPPVVPLTRNDFERMAALGLDSVRLVVSWSALEPRPGFHDPAYLEQIRRAVEWSREFGIYVILDMHQDAWGKYIASAPDVKCRWPLVPNIGWDGAPEWATITDGKEPCKLVQREFSGAAFQAWQSFYEDRDGIQQRLVDTWARLAAAFKDDPAVAGYDLLNEPNWGRNAARAVRQYKPAFYRRATDAIRAAEEGGLHKIIFFEPLAIWSALPGERPVPFTGDPDVVYAPHIYLGSISVDMYLFHHELIPLRRGFEIAQREAEQYHTTFWNGEWMPGPGGHAYRYAALEDEFQTGSARWIWKTACGDPHRMAPYWPDRQKVAPGKTHSVIIMRCGDADHPAGVEEGLNPIDAVVLSRPYPRAFPAPADFTTDPRGRRLLMSGTAPDGNVPLLVWVPGKAEPALESDGLREVSLRRVEGGWLLSALPGPGPWRLRAAGRE